MTKSSYEKGLEVWLSKLNKGIRTNVANLVRVALKHNPEKNSLLVCARLNEVSVQHVPKGLPMVLSDCSAANLLERQKNQTYILATVEKTIMKKNRMEINLLIDVNDKVDLLKRRISSSTFLHFIPNPSKSPYFFISNHHRFVSFDIGFQWSLVHSLMPLRKLCSPCGVNQNKKRICLQSRNEVESSFSEEELCRFLKDIRYTLSHSAEISELEKLCEATVEEVTINNRHVSVNVTLDEVLDFWDNTDIFLHPNGLYSDSKCLPSTSGSHSSGVVTDTVPQEIDTVVEPTLADTLKLIGGWKYLDGKFERHRRSILGNWKNVYLTEIRLEPWSEEVLEMIKKVEIGTCLRLSIQSDVPGPIFVKVVDFQDESHVIVVEVVRFEDPDVKLPLSRQSKYFLHVDDTVDDDDRISFASECHTLDGYQFIENVDEICQEIGDLVLCEATVKIYSDVEAESTSVHSRLAFTSENEEMRLYRSIEGVYVYLFSKERDNCVLAVVSRLMSDVIILSIAGKNDDFEVTQDDIYYIRPAHEFTKLLRSLRKEHPKFDKSEKIRKSIVSNESDLRYIRFYIDGVNRKKYCQFSVKSDLFPNIENGTVFLISKCWDVDDVIEKKTDFAFGIKTRSPDDTSPDEPTTVWFEIRRLKKRFDSKSSEDMYFGKSYYYIEPERREFIELQKEWKRFDVLVKTGVRSNTFASRCPELQITIPFKINSYWKTDSNSPKRDTQPVEMKRTSSFLSAFTGAKGSNFGSSTSFLNSSEPSSSFSTTTTTIQTEKSTVAETENDCDETLETKQLLTEGAEKIDKPSRPLLLASSDEFSECGFINVTDFLTHTENEHEYRLYLIIDVMEDKENEGFDCNVMIYSVNCFENDQRLYFCLDHANPSIFIVGDVIATHQNKVKIEVDQKLSDMDLVLYWIGYMLNFQIKDMFMLCYKKKEKREEEFVW